MVKTPISHVFISLLHSHYPHKCLFLLGPFTAFGFELVDYQPSCYTAALFFLTFLYMTGEFSMAKLTCLLLLSLKSLTFLHSVLNICYAALTGDRDIPGYD